MSIYQVDEHTFTHTCPADDQPHPFDTQRVIVAITPGRDCLTPVTIRCGDNRVTIPCGEYRSHDQQCAACRTIITIRCATADDLGPDEPTAAGPTGTHAADPCVDCGELLAAVLAPAGRHLLCHPWDRR